uniref:DUF3362 domain-containing protein n=1 Tax=Globodera pallida TaxID=36090 RepID=A0A183CR60_GLOPA
LLEMIKNPFANNVVQKMLHVADSVHRKKIMFAINTAPRKNTAKDHQNRLPRPFKHKKGAGPNNG